MQGSFCSSLQVIMVLTIINSICQPISAEETKLAMLQQLEAAIIDVAFVHQHSLINYHQDHLHRSPFVTVFPSVFIILLKCNKGKICLIFYLMVLICICKPYISHLYPRVRFFCWNVALESRFL